MRPMYTLMRREFAAYFLSPIAYVVLVLFLAGTGALFIVTFGALTQEGPTGVEWPLQGMFGGATLIDGVFGGVVFWLPFLVIPAVLTMRSFAEERSTGTLEALLTTPLRDWQVVFAKYAAAFGFFFVLLLPTFLYLPALFGFRSGGADELVWRQTELTTSLAASLAGCALLFMLMRLPVHGSLKFLLFVAPLPIAAFLYFYLPNQQLERGLIAAGIAAGAAAATFLAVYLLVWLVTALFGSRSPDRVGAVFCILLTLLVIGTAVVFGIALWRREVVLPRAVLTTYLGLLLAGAMFLAIGLFVSSLVKSQLVAVLVSLFLSLIFVVLAFVPLFVESSSIWYSAVNFLTVPMHFRLDFTRGIIDSRHLILYGSVALFFLFMTVRSLESRRWR